MSKSAVIKAAWITGAATILAAVVGGLFLFLSRDSDKVGQETVPSKTQSKLPVPPSILTQQTGPSRQPKSKLDRLIEINGGLSEGDRARLTNALFEFSEAISQANVLWGRANQAGARLNQAWRDGSIAKDFDAHKNTLSAINSSAKEFKQSFSQLRDKWKYYSDQTNYIFGDNPDNEGPNAIINAVEGYSNYLDRWIRIQNKEDRSVLDLFDTQQREFNERIRGFALWKQDRERRLEQMKKSIQ